MHPPSSNPNSRRRWFRSLGGLAALLVALTILAGCRSDTKQKWLNFFFDDGDRDITQILFSIGDSHVDRDGVFAGKWLVMFEHLLWL